MNGIEWPLILSDKVVTIWKLHSKRNTVILRTLSGYTTDSAIIDGTVVRVQGDTYRLQDMKHAWVTCTQQARFSPGQEHSMLPQERKVLCAFSENNIVQRFP